MNLFETFRNKLSLGLKGRCEEVILNKIVLINAMGFLSILVLLTFSLINLLEQNFLASLLNLFCTLILILNTIYLYRSHQIVFAGWVLTALISFYLLFLLVTGLGDHSVILWFFAIPLAAIILMGHKQGSYFSLAFLLLTSVIIFFPNFIIPHFEYSLGFKLRFVGSYAALLFMIYVFQYSRVLYLRETERNLLEAKNEIKSKEEFISRISHQIRTPLNNILLIGNMVRKDNMTEEQQDLLDTILASASNLTNVVNNIATITNTEFTERAPVSISFNLNTTIINTLKLFSGNRSSGTQVKYAAASSLPAELTGDPVVIKQILLNIIETILKEESEKGMGIMVGAHVNKTIRNMVEVKFEIATNKPVQLLFAENSLSVYNSNEISYTNVSEMINLSDLKISRNLIEQHKGSMDVKTSPDKSLIISFTLPFLKTGRSESESSGLENNMSTGQGGRDKKQQLSRDLRDANVLVVEDNLINQKIVVLSLKKLVRNIDVAENGKEALDKFGTSKYDIILMDIQMPVMDGLIATKKIREIEASTNSHTPIIAITANALHGDRETCLSAGMNEYLAKPFQVEVLIDKMKKLLSQTG
jgi:CheY-like chemotaxis protein/signal transduction histidine kinase